MDSLVTLYNQLSSGFEKLVADPSANLAALATAIAVIVIAVLIVVLLLLAIALPADRARQRKGGGKRRRKRPEGSSGASRQGAKAHGVNAASAGAPGRGPGPKPQSPAAKSAEKRRRRRSDPRATAAAFAVFLIGLFSTFAITYDITSTNQYCGSTCHAMDDAANAWERSSHANVDCVRCHEGPKWQSMPQAIVLRLHDLSRQFGYNDFRDLRVPASNCLNCHDRVMDLSLEGRNGELFTHRQVVTPHTRCNDCHGSEGHIIPQNQ